MAPQQREAESPDAGAGVVDGQEHFAARTLEPTFLDGHELIKGKCSVSVLLQVQELRFEPVRLDGMEDEYRDVTLLGTRPAADERRISPSERGDLVQDVSGNGIAGSYSVPRDMKG